MQSEQIRSSRAVLAGLVISLGCLAVLAYYTASDTWGPIMAATYEEPRMVENYPAPVRYVGLLFMALNPLTALLVDFVVLPEVGGSAQVQAWLWVLLNLLGSVSWWWVLARVSRWRQSRAISMRERRNLAG
jgi:threonine/homoserine/homoserine lactone efflux protein